ncbi:glycosyl transferase family 8 [Staphylococcus schleiferi]|uniref:accessory Sec system glycosylation chaperone GtfB n=1 Tax=Staphylococcus coagulans TaxID=74706 RepID=UPI000679EEDB|nr:accessory Sec system glycosylation chaperone GtfB [Staphylococcus coagulans]AKS72697.1 glycosyl transferase family 8 [Staphylococcus schleiferi]MBA8764690.1 accessory Sec system glycosylation chaperone GtfB [Staphylococcus coagulans]MBT2810146.1 accessory Sec system glycosylation chaperone GtfB [Staphylococcus coagulans]MBT2819844.1 accessory Sec system glycosylation chaperone GtfB [Staphylococcus coagulans]MBT2821673.1 accessory Sec system glycosylation chaperone GtfB [Staphylococcus coagu
MVNLFENFDSETKALYDSLSLADEQAPTIVLEDDGFLPEGMITPYQFFANYRAPKNGRPLYFNEIPVPRFWEIEGNNEEAWVKDMSQKRAMIQYRPGEKRRHVSHVEWLNQQGKLQYVDHYTQHGVLFAQTVYDLNRNIIFRRYFDQDGKDVIYYNFLAQSVVLNWKGEQYHFESHIAFLTFFLEALEIDLNHFVVNSLGTPFSVLYYLNHRGQDVLYWQEHCKGNVPGNMELIFNNDTGQRDFQIVVTHKEEYEAIAEAVNEDAREVIHDGGYLYQYEKTNTYQPQILTMTNTDQIHHIASIIEACPFATFHIGAVTEMSSVLTQLERYKNIRLYQAIELSTVEKLYQKCDIYLDINEGGEIIDAVRKAFNYDMLILGYATIAHNRTYTAPQNLFSKEDEAAALKQALRDVYLKKRYFKVRQNYQKAHANEITVKQFKTIHQLAYGQK